MEDITLQEIIDYAKINEDNARQFYQSASEHVKQENVKGFLKSLAAHEQKHLDQLTALEALVDAGWPVPKPHGIVKPLGYSDFVGAVKIGEDADYQEVLKVAMAKEKEAMDSYIKYSNLVDDQKAKDLFLLLAGEESKHLREFEEKYDDFMKEIENW